VASPHRKHNPQYAGGGADDAGGFSRKGLVSNAGVFFARMAQSSLAFFHHAPNALHVFRECMMRQPFPAVLFPASR
jgi:hypothetical protein